jgi:nucleotide-binding universal stress UspA family protein
MNTIVVPLDGSPLAEAVLPHVRGLAALFGARVHLLHVIASPDQIVVGKGAEPGTVEQRGHYLTEQAARFAGAGIEVTTEVQIGRPPAVILERATAEGATLIAMASHGYSGLRRWTLGSVTDKVVHAAKAPVFVVRAPDAVAPSAEGIRRIMIPLDGSDLARSAIQPAVEIAERAKADLLLLTAMEPASDAYAMVAHTDLLTALDTALQAERQELGADPRLAGHTVNALVAEGMPADVIVDVAAHREIDLIVMATHGRSGLSRWTLGSVADKVLHSTTVPLVLVRVPPAYEPEE